VNGLTGEPVSRLTKHIFAGANRVCSVNSQTGTQANPQTYYYHSDHLGSSNVITDQTGQQIQYCEYTPYGTLARNELANPLTGTPVNHYFTGKELDNTGLYFYAWRYYDPTLGRFIQPDTIIPNPFNPQEFNRYSYCNNNPLNYTDPSGHRKLFASIENMFVKLERWLEKVTNSEWDINAEAGSSTSFGGGGGGGKPVNPSREDIDKSTYDDLARHTNENQYSSSYSTGSYADNTNFNNIDTVRPWLRFWNDLLSPVLNTLSQPGYNYGNWVYGEKNFSNFFGACLDSAWAITGIGGAIGIAKVGYNSTFYQYYGPGSNPNSQWVTRVKYSLEVANQKLSSPTQWTSMREVNGEKGGKRGQSDFYLDNEGQRPIYLKYL